METRSLGKILVLILLIPLSFIIGAWVLTNPTGAISGLSKLSTIAIAFIALTNPRLGLFLLVPQVIYTDQVKRLAVSYGALSYTTIYEVLLAPLITLGCLNAGYFVSAIFGKSSLSRNWIVFYILNGCLFILLFATGEGTIPTRTQLALNTCAYLTLIPLMAAFLDDADKVRKFLICQAWWALPSALWGIQQYYRGFSAMEMDYARTGLSSTHYLQLILSDSPRPFGFFGSNSGFSSVVIFGIIALIYLKIETRGRVWNFLLFCCYAWAIYASKQRTVLLIIPLALFSAWCFRSRFFTKAYYGLLLGTFALGIAYSDFLLTTGIDKVNAAISTNTKWGREVLNVGTFSDRLRGWSRLKKASTYSFFGTRERSVVFNGKTDLTASNYNHDVINKILIETGVAGLAVFIGLLGYCLMKLHGMVQSTKDRMLRWEMSVILATVFMVVFLSLTAGSILSTNPINLLIWSSAGAFLILEKRNRALREVSAVSTAPAVQVLGQGTPRRLPIPNPDFRTGNNPASSQ